MINYADSFSALHLTICRNIFSKLLRNDFRRIRYKNSSRDQVEIVVMPHAVLKIISHRFWVYVENVLGLVTRASTFFCSQQRTMYANRIFNWRNDELEMSAQWTEAICRNEHAAVSSSIEEKVSRRSFYSNNCEIAWCSSLFFLAHLQK